MPTAPPSSADPRPASAVQAEIRQSRPFRSLGQEATIALLRTASVVNRAISRIVEPYGLSLAQYNALRIIRGSGVEGIPTLAIRERMIEEGTTITRLLDKLEDAGFIRRERTIPDRRQVICIATAEGRALLDDLDPIVDQSDADVVSTLDERELRQFIALLDAIRTRNAGRGAPRSAPRATPRVRPAPPQATRRDMQTPAEERARDRSEEPFIIRRRKRSAP